jgi:hypothetical protein
MHEVDSLTYSDYSGEIQTAQLCELFQNLVSTGIVTYIVAF